MDGRSLYDEDILAWAEQQAGVLRRLAADPRGLPNELDLQHLAEEIEDVGKSELHRAESVLRLLLVHLLKIASAPNARSLDHWRREARLFQAELADSMSASIRAKLDLDRRWELAKDTADGELVREDDRVLSGLPDPCPLSFDDVLAERPDIDSLAEKIRIAARSA
jgi:hypothetical protein